jgi:hypothetical protein
MSCRRRENRDPPAQAPRTAQEGQRARTARETPAINSRPNFLAWNAQDAGKTPRGCCPPAELLVCLQFVDPKKEKSPSLATEAIFPLHVKNEIRPHHWENII